MKKTFYVTTPIYYPSGDLHIGHAYTTVLADTLKKYKQQQGYDVYFLTGSDEHGQKIAQKAKEKGLEPIKYLDQQIEKFKQLWSLLEIDYDQFIRTTNPKHELAVQQIFSDLITKEEIYKGKYTGKYCIPCESSWQLSQLEKEDGKYVCQDCKRPVSDVEEDSFFLKLKGKEDFLKNLFKKDFLFPKRNVNELLSKFIEPGLLDLSVSRSTFDWGVPVKEDPNHVVYVWVDALPNYITALGYNCDDTKLFDKFWTNDTEILHVVGKEIVRFHAIYWPVILNDLGIMKDNIKVMGHGWITSEGKKMSKSIGNVIDPVAITNEYGLEHLRYYLLKEIQTSSDGDFAHSRFIQSYNVDLANKYGNLISRTMGMIEKYFDGIIPEYNGQLNELDKALEKTLDNGIKNYLSNMDKYMISSAIKDIINMIDETNLYIDNTKPWVLAKDKTKEKELKSVMNHLIKSIEVASFLFKPILFKTAPKALEQINILDTTFDNLLDYSKNNNIKLGEKINLFPRIEAQ